jgi:membrane-bound lytic murein transglycosylase D
LPGDYEKPHAAAGDAQLRPKLQAVKNIVANPQAYGLRLADLPNRPYFATVTVDRHIDVKLAARLAELPLEEFIFLNPAHNKPVIKAQSGETFSSRATRSKASGAISPPTTSLWFRGRRIP